MSLKQTTKVIPSSMHAQLFYCNLGKNVLSNLDNYPLCTRFQSQLVREWSKVTGKVGNKKDNDTRQALHNAWSR